jgi:hypothetical protein
MADFGLFAGDAFNVVQLTEAINIVPNKYGRVNELGLFSNQSVETTAVFIEMTNGVLNILPPTVRGGPASVGSVDKRKGKSFNIPIFAHEDAVKADEIQNIRAFGKTSELQTVQDKVIQKLAAMRNKHDITLEYMRCGALQGKIKDDEGKLLLDLFAEFDVTQKSYDFKFGTPGTKIDGILREISRYIEKNLKGETMTSIHAIASSKFFEAFITHPRIEKAYEAYQGLTPLREDVRRGFKFQNLFIEEYVGEASTKTGTVLPFIPEGEAIFFPRGTTSTFKTYFAPADFIETANTPGLPIYAKQAADKFNRFIEIHTQSCPLPIVTRPALLVRATSSDWPTS